MDKIKKYIAKFLKRNSINIRYTLYTNEWRALTEHAVGSISTAMDATGTAFKYGYAKGYKAAQAEMKKGGEA